eukprot:2195774-Rhodomonas_salina.1
MCDAGSEPALDLLCLPWGTIGKLWPAERVVMGLRVCKVLRHELLEHVHQVTLIKSKGTAASDLALAKDLARFGEQNAVTLTWGDGRNHSCSSVLQVAIPTSCYACWATSTAALSSTFPAALKSLHLKEVQESDIASLKDVLSESKNLTRIDLSESGVGDSMATLAQGFQACTKLQHVKLVAFSPLPSARHFLWIRDVVSGNDMTLVLPERNLSGQRSNAEPRANSRVEPERFLFRFHSARSGSDGAGLLAGAVRSLRT